MSKKNKFLDAKIKGPKTLLMGVHAPDNQSNCKKNYFDEFLNLIKTAEIECDEELFIKLRSIDKANFLTKGKLLDLHALCQDKNIDLVVCSEILSSLQERNLEQFLGCQVWDREKVIIEIFSRSAHTAEGKIQVEMAQLEYHKTRLSGKGIQLAQQEGHIGSRGPGETEKELIKRHLNEKFRRANKRLEDLKKSRDIQRKSRLESKNPLICLVGYTNSGKSSILNTLTNSDILAEDKLFATLDTTTRKLFFNGKPSGLISDTVGFISNLPHHLIKAFKSTLDELYYSSLLLHIIDASNPEWPNHIKVVLETLSDLDVNTKDQLFVFNKSDKLDSDQLKELKEEVKEYNPNVIVCAKSKEGLLPLRIKIQQLLSKKLAKAFNP
jgi:GTPase